MFEEKTIFNSVHLGTENYQGGVFSLVRTNQGVRNIKE